jgi:hypothetical protein
MADYYPLIARAIAGLDKNSGEGRRVLYERARTALVTQLRSVVPALSESDITRERLSLEEAIRKVEAEAARQTRETPRPDPAANRRSHIRAVEDPRPGGAVRRDPPGSDRRDPPQADVGSPRHTPPPPPRPPADRRGYPDVGLKHFQDVVEDAQALGEATAQAARSARKTFAAVPAPPGQEYARLEPRVEPERMRPPQRNGQIAPDVIEQHSVEPSFGGSLEPSLMDDEQMPSITRKRPERPLATIEELDRPGPRSQLASFGRSLKPLIALLILAILGGFIYWQRYNLTDALHGMLPREHNATTSAGVTPKPEVHTAKIPDRLGQTTPSDINAPQRVVLYEEDPSDASGKQFKGTVTWRTETTSPSPGQAPELAVRATIEIPERQMTVSWLLHRNTDKTLPASHTIEIVFTLPADFPHISISNIPGLLMKQAEQTRGVPLAGQSVKVTTGYFLIGLSAVDSDLQRNVQLLKERTWFDIPIVYGDQRRAILAVEKGAPGEHAFADAFASWTR